MCEYLGLHQRITTLACYSFLGTNVLFCGIEGGANVFVINTQSQSIEVMNFYKTFYNHNVYVVQCRELYIFTVVAYEIHAIQKLYRNHSSDINIYDYDN